MKTIKDKQILVGADRAGFPLKEVIVQHLKKKGWTVTDIGVKSADEENPEMFHRIGLKVGAKIAENRSVCAERTFRAFIKRLRS